jgi:hypothetical protein
MDLVGVALGFFLALIPKGWSRWHTARGHLIGLRAEVHKAASYADTYRKDDKASPLYRLPAGGTIAAWQWLSQNRLFTSEETEAFLEFIDLVDQINRGLERAGLAGANWVAEHDRICIKIGHLLDRENGRTTSRYEDASAVITQVESRLARFPWGLWPTRER